MNGVKQLKLHQAVTLSILSGLLVLTFALCIGLGSVKISIPEVFKILLFPDTVNATLGDIVWNIRFPRTLGALAGGASLAVAGIMLQVFFRNPIVEPFVLGISSGAVLCVALMSLGGVALGFHGISPYGLFVAALIGALSVTAVVVLFASRVKDVVTLLVIGLMVGYICSAFTNILIAMADKEQLHGFMIWTLGSFSGFTWSSVKVLGVMGMPVLGALLFIVKPLNAFLMGEEYAKSMGVNIRFFRIILVVISSVLAAVVTAFAGPVAFIGLAVPHMARMLFKTADNRVLIPGTLLLGGLVTCLCDLIARTAMAPVELPISAVTAFFGAPIVIFLIMNRRTAL